ncbi:MAG: non-canonical purine NTP pyrophosphatase [Nitrospirota bacterium]
MGIPSRPTLRELFRSGERRLEVFFYTSNLEKFLQAKTVFDRSGLVLKHFKSKTDPYIEDYSFGKERLLTRAIREISDVIGKHSFFFVEDTSLRIDSLSSNEKDFPGLSVKEWFAKTTFEDLDMEIKRLGQGRAATIKSDIALHVPGLPRPLFFHGEVCGSVAESAPKFPENDQYPWLTARTFNGWFIPDGAEKRLGEMSLEESWQYDFRTKSLESLINRLEEYAAVLNLPPHAYSRSQHLPPTGQLQLLPANKPILIVVGKTCVGKTTFGERALQAHSLCWVEASDILRTFKTQYDDEPARDFDFAKHTLEIKGADIVARKILQLYSDKLSDGLIITGFRTIEELETIKERIPQAQVVLVEASERIRFQRHLARGRLGNIKALREFRAHDIRQWSFGLLRVAEDFADIRVTNEGTLQDYWQQIEFLLRNDTGDSFRGVSRRVHPRHGLKDNQLYRCLLVMGEEGRPLSCDEIQKLTGASGQSIRHNNANKVLKRVPELANRFELSGERVRYEIAAAGRAYIRYMKLQFAPEKSI